MSAKHTHHLATPHHDPMPNNSRQLAGAFFLNLFFTIIEIFGGIWTNSTAILADAVHDLGDSVALGFAWYFEKRSLRSGDDRYTYGYRRFSLVGALISTVILVAGSVYVINEAVTRLQHPEPSHAQGMLLFALLGILVNGWAVLRLRRGSGLNLKIAAWHLIEDVLGWLMILIASIVLLFIEAPRLDPSVSLIITLYVLWHVFANLRATMAILLQSAPDACDLAALEQQLQQLPEILAVHHTHLWTLDGSQHVFSAHLVVPHHANGDDLVQIKRAVRAILRQHGIVHSTLEIENPHEHTSEHIPPMCRPSVSQYPHDA